MITNFCSVFQVISVCPFFRNYPNKPLMDKWNLNIFSPQSSNRDSVGVAPRRLLQSNAINCLNEVLFVKAGLGMFVMFSLPSHSRPYPLLSLSRPFRDPILLLTDIVFSLPRSPSQNGVAFSPLPRLFQALKASHSLSSPLTNVNNWPSSGSAAKTVARMGRRQREDSAICWFILL